MPSRIDPKTFRSRYILVSNRPTSLSSVYYARPPLLRGPYLGICEIGRGASAVVWRAIDRRSGRRVALKIYHDVYTDAGYLARAASTYSRLLSRVDINDRYFLQLLNQDTCRLDGYLALELGGTSLHDILRAPALLPLPARHVRHMVQQLLRAIAFNGRAVVDKRRSSAGNFLDTDDLQISAIKVIDLDDAVATTGSRRFIVGTDRYRAPEVSVGMVWSQSIDMFSVGCVAVELSSGRPLFRRSAGTLDRLAAIERVVGLFPLSFVHAEPWVRLLFKAGKRPTVAFESSVYGNRSFNRVASMVPLQEVVHDMVLLRLCNALLNLEPAARVTPRLALEHEYFADPM
ncbi:kinase-like domain-containing protein [Mycena vulgaris]|nr:kinase-like domain-containing protein [Mycena vulgaris]